jgi:ferredoxin
MRGEEGLSHFTITIEDTGETYRCASTESVLDGMARLGKKGIPVGCRGGGCGVCKVHVVEGTYQARVMSREHVSEVDQAEHRVLACRVRPTSDLRLVVLGKMKKAVFRSVVASAGEGDAAVSGAAAG